MQLVCAIGATEPLDSGTRRQGDLVVVLCRCRQKCAEIVEHAQRSMTQAQPLLWKVQEGGTLSGRHAEATPSEPPPRPPAASMALVRAMTSDGSASARRAHPSSTSACALDTYRGPHCSSEKRTPSLRPLLSWCSRSRASTQGVYAATETFRHRNVNSQTAQLSPGKCQRASAARDGNMWRHVRFDRRNHCNRPG